MEQERRIRVAITQGDTNGVGYEVILKAFADPEKNLHPVHAEELVW